jgi:hypothetical protein
MTRLQTLFPLAAILLLAGCAEQNISSIRPRSNPLSSSASVYVSISQNGQFENHTYSNSGRQTSLIIADLARDRFANVEIAEALQSQEESLACARALKCSYLIRPLITNWEDHNTPWTGIQDRAEVELRTFDVASGATLDIGRVQAIGTFFTFVNDRPEDLLAEPIKKYLNFLIGIAPLPSP